MTITTNNKPKTVADKIRIFRDEFIRDYMKRHKRFDMHRFTAAFLEKTPVKKQDREKIAQR